jgi:hypothetical protein
MNKLSTDYNKLGYFPEIFDLNIVYSSTKCLESIRKLQAESGYTVFTCIL